MRPNPQEIEDLVTFTKEIFNGKPHFLCSDGSQILMLSKVTFQKRSKFGYSFSFL